MRNLYITDKHEEAASLWAVCDLDTGEVVHTCKSGDDQGKAQAMTILASAYDWDTLTAAVAGDLVAFKSNPAIAFVGVETSDGRVLVAGGEKFREMPLPLMLQMETQFGHTGAVIAGRFDSMAVDGDNVIAAGVLDTGFGGTEAERLMSNNMLTGVSVDLGEIEVETEILDVDSDGFPIDFLDRFVVWEVMGATLTPFPAFAGAALTLQIEEDEDTDDDTDEEGITAAGILADPPIDWFEDPEFAEATPITISDEGHVSGHIAVWGSCHIGRQGVCVTPPRSKSDYSYFTTGYVQCGDGCQVPTGIVTLGGGHADLALDANAARKHYDESGSGIADIAIGEDEHGVWVNGSLRPGVTDAEVREIRATSPSGDWRVLDGNLELIAVLQVNVPGYPVPRARTAAGEQIALVAAVAPRPPDANSMPTWAVEMKRTQDHHARMLRALSPDIANRLQQAVRTP